MLKKSFLEYVQLREADENKDKSVNSKISLGDGNDLKPFYVGDDPNGEHYGKSKNLAPIIRAFKKGANWGWGKDDKTGDDKPVKITGKKLYLTGGALRDHLAGRKPRNIELATNASPDEVFRVLSQNKFKFIDEKEKDDAKGNVFFVSSINNFDRPFSFIIKVKNDEYELGVLTKTPKGKNGGKPESGTHAEDAASRDFTINSMYLTLSNDNGPNKELHDFHGGLHDLLMNKVSTIGNMEDSFGEDPLRMIKFGRMIDRYGDLDKVSAEDKEAISKNLEKIKGLNKDDVLDEFLRGLKHDDVDSRKYIGNYDKLGLLDSIFPDFNLDKDLPKELSELGDKHAPISYMMRMNHPMKIKSIGFPQDILNKVLFLTKSFGLHPSMNEDDLDELRNSFMSSGMTGRKFKEFAGKLGGKDDNTIDSFLNHANSPRVRVIIVKDGEEVINKEFEDLHNPITKHPFDVDAVDRRRKKLEHGAFKKHLGGGCPMSHEEDEMPHHEEHHGGG